MLAYIPYMDPMGYFETSYVENLKHGIVSKSGHEQNPIGLSGSRQKPTVVSSSLRPTTRAPP